MTNNQDIQQDFEKKLVDIDLKLNTISNSSHLGKKGGGRIQFASQHKCSAMSF